MCMLVECAAIIFFFKQKTAYEMRISDWSSDVCSSDLADVARADLKRHDIVHQPGDEGHRDEKDHDDAVGGEHLVEMMRGQIALRPAERHQIGRASCRERVCQYV